MMKKQGLMAGAVMMALATYSTAQATPFNNSTGLTSPQHTVTFSEVALPQNTLLTSQYSADGVTFSGVMYEDLSFDGAFANTSGPDGTDFQPPSCPCGPSFTIHFNSPVNEAAFVLVDRTYPGGQPAILTAYLGATQVDSLSINVPRSANDYVGFTGVYFDSINVLEPADTNQSALIDNIQFGNAVVPEPAALALLGVGLAGLGMIRRRKVA